MDIAEDGSRFGDDLTLDLLLGRHAPHRVCHVVLRFDELRDNLIYLQVRTADVVDDRVRPDARSSWNVLEEHERQTTVLEREPVAPVEDLTLTPANVLAVLEVTVPTVRVG